MSGCNCVGGNHAITTHRDMAMFDELPPRLRAKLRDLPFLFSAESVWNLIHVGFSDQQIERRLDACCKGIIDGTWP